MGAVLNRNTALTELLLGAGAQHSVLVPPGELLGMVRPEGRGETEGRKNGALGGEGGEEVKTCCCERVGGGFRCQFKIRRRRQGSWRVRGSRRLARSNDVVRGRCWPRNPPARTDAIPYSARRRALH
jgi:hypothetical protein